MLMTGHEPCDDAMYPLVLGVIFELFIFTIRHNEMDSDSWWGDHFVVLILNEDSPWP
jgi:hypothetical protein